MDTEIKKRLVVPAVLAIASLAIGGCVTPAPANDAATQNDSALADADFDAGCIPPEQYDPISRTCIPLV